MSTQRFSPRRALYMCVLAFIGILVVAGVFLIALPTHFFTQSTDEFNQQYDAAQHPEARDFPEGSYKEFTANNTKNVATDDTESSPAHGEYMFGARRDDAYRNLAWAELIFTPSEAGTGYFAHSRAETLKDNGEFDTIVGKEFDLQWDETGKEYRASFWMPHVFEEHNDIFQIELPEGSQWKIRVHPPEHAPTVTGDFASDSQLQAFYYDPEKSGSRITHHTQRIDDGSTYDSGAYTHPNPVDELSGTELFDVLAGDKSEDTHSYSIKGDNPPIPVQVSARNARWIFSPKG